MLFLPRLLHFMQAIVYANLFPWRSVDRRILGGVFLIGVTLLYGLIKIFRNWYSNDAIQGSKSQPVDWNKQTTKQHSPVSALLERERTRYFSLPVLNPVSLLITSGLAFSRKRKHSCIGIQQFKYFLCIRVHLNISFFPQCKI